MQLLSMNGADIPQKNWDNLHRFVKEKLEPIALKNRGKANVEQLAEAGNVSYETMRKAMNKSRFPGAESISKFSRATGVSAISIQHYFENGEYLDESALDDEAVVSYMTGLKDSDFSKVMSEIFKKRSG